MEGEVERPLPCHEDPLQDGLAESTGAEAAVAEEVPQTGEPQNEAFSEDPPSPSPETAAARCRFYGAPHPFNAKSFSFNDEDALSKETMRLLAEPCLCRASLPPASTPPQQLPLPQEQERWEDPLKARRQALENRRALEGPDPKLSLAISQLKMKHKSVQHVRRLCNPFSATLPA